MRLKHSALILVAGLMLLPSFMWSQGPGGGFGKGGFGKGGDRGDRGNGGGGGGFGGGGDQGGGRMQFQMPQGGGFGGGGAMQFQIPQGGGGGAMQFQMPLSGMPQGGGGGFPGMGGGGMRTMPDPDTIWNTFLGGAGKESISLDTMNPIAKSMLQRFGPMLGLTGNETTISKEQFRTMSARGQQLAQSGQLPQVMQQAGIQMPQGGMPGMGGGGERPRMLDERQVEEGFRQRDQNGDGVLDNNELSSRLREQRDTYDTNHDGFIDYNEYRAYVSSAMGIQIGDTTQNQPNPMQPGGMPGMMPGMQDPMAQRAIVYTASNLPRDLPPWFGQMDGSGDRDGQVGLYEWRAMGARTADFLTYDLNNDGFITVEEYYRYRQLSMEAQGGSMANMLGGNRGPNGNFSGNLPGAGPGGDRGRGPGGDRGGMGMMPGGLGGDRGDRGRGPGGDRGGIGMMPSGQGSFGQGQGGPGRGPGAGTGMMPMMPMMPGGDRGSRGPGGMGMMPGGDRGSRGPGGMGTTPGGNFPGASMVPGGRGPGATPGMGTPPGGAPGTGGPGGRTRGR